MDFDSDRDVVPEEVAQKLWHQADQARQRGDLETQLEANRQLLSIVQQEGRIAAEIVTLRQLGNVYQNLGNLRYAHAYRLAAGDLVNIYADQLPAGTRVRVEIDIGRSYIEVQEWDKGEIHTRRAEADAKNIENPRDRQFTEAVIYNNFSLIYAATGRHAQALDILKKALEIAQALNDAYLLSLTHLNLATQYVNNFQLVTGRQHAREAYRYAEISRDPMQRAKAQLLLGTISTRSHALRGTLIHSGEALDHFERSARLAQNLGNPMMIADAEIQQALLYEETGKISEAGAHFRTALDALELVRADLGYEQFQLAYFASLQHHYEQAILFQLRQQQTELAFQTMEQLRSRLLLTLLGPERWDLNEWTEEEQAALRDVLGRYGAVAIRQITGQVEQLSDASFTLGLGDETQDVSPSDDPNLNQARRDFLDLYNSQRASRVEWLGRQSPPLANLTALQQLLTPQEALISYLCAYDGLVIFSITHDSVHFQNLNLPLPRLQEAIDHTCQAMAELQDEVLDLFLAEQWFNRAPQAPWPRRVAGRMNTLQQHLDQLFALLIAPILPAVAAQTHWVIIPNGPLHRVPWAALHSRDGYLVEARTLSLLPSASVGAALATLASPETERPVMALGAPDPDDSMLGLPAARREVEMVQNLFPGSLPPFLGEQANKTNFLRWASTAQLLHLACHHCFDGRAPLLSFLKLFGERGDQFLFAFEIADLELQAGLVTLSACESGRSQIATGDEQFGIVRSFLAAGAQSVISSLWHIQDQSASIFFGDFYRLARQAPLGQALAETQRRMLALPQYQLPCFWAPYVLTGKWRDRLVV